MKKFTNALFGHFTVQRRVPFLPALSITECGPACLTMILHYFGAKIKVSEVAERCRTGRAGVSAASLVSTGLVYGLSLKVLAASLSDLATVATPAILHWNFNHWVVLEKWDSRTPTIVDPAIGRIKINIDEVSCRFTGVVLVGTPNSYFLCRKDRNSALRAFLIKAIRNTDLKLMTLLALGAALTGQLLALGLTFFSKLFVDSVLPRHMSNLMPVLALMGLAVIAGRLLCNYIRGASLTRMRSRLDSEFMTGLVHHLLHLPFPFFQERADGDLLNRLSSYSSMRQALGDQALATIVDSLFAVIYVSAAVCIDLRVAPLIVAVFILEGTLLLIRFGSDSAMLRSEVVAEQRNQSVLIDALRGIQYVKASGIEEYIFARWRSLFARQVEVRASRGYRHSLVDSAIDVMTASVPLLILWYGSLEVLNGRMSLGTVFMLVFLISACLAPLQALVGRLQQLQYVLAYVERLDDILATQPTRKRDLARRHVLSGQVEAQDLTFAFPGESQYSLGNISFRINPGTKTVLVGRTGAGKTTLLMLLLGLYKPTEGSVLFDGIRLEDLDPEDLRTQVGVVLQDDVLFEGTILTNLLLSKPNAQFEDVIRAATLVGIHQEIMSWPAGYETYVAEGARNLSGGQKQRLTLARALLGNPQILVMDEPNSHLDLETEASIEHALNQLHCTRIIATHRPWATVDADYVLKLHKGKLIHAETSELPTTDGDLVFRKYADRYRIKT